ncbi:MAG TPA: exodeoxyribonuclease VII small subunit [Lacipirellulaceae bacterium]|nr:exodeoxyribonuclease VII small subunit [Lacipirellulaceae bacterium]
MSKKKPDSDPDPGITFEASLEELEQIVVHLEGGKLGLAESLAAYEQGVRRLRGCYQMLSAAERRIELVQSVDADGKVTAEPFDDEAPEDLAEKSTARSRRRTARVDAEGGLF